VDFSEYRPTTIRRRIIRRMALLQQQSLPQYLRLLADNPTEVKALYRDMLINVTSFFRDPTVSEALKSSVFPAIVKDKSQDKPIRIWVPGCSTGQEAYSIAMALLEFLDQWPAPPALPAPSAPRIQIFGTDLNDAAAVERARPGIYPPSIEAEVSPQRLQRFFNKVEGGYRISQAIRDLCIFARQDVTSDPPFSRLDLISCRNLLIYLSPSLQQRIIPTFHYCLNAGGFLVLGPSETVGKFTDLFAPVDRAHRIYSRTEVLARPHAFVGGGYPPLPPVAGATAAVRTPAVADMRREADRVLLGRFAPAAVLIDENMEILQFRGKTAPFLTPPSGQPTHNVLKMVRNSLFLPLRSAIDEAQKQNAAARREQVRVQDEQQERLVDLEVTPLRLHGGPGRCYMVLFLEARAPAATGTEGTTVPAPADVHVGTKVLGPATESVLASENAQLQQELTSVKDYLQAIIEQQNAANEELQSANEEIRSANEELQSTNEEMQTSKEELQSTNEELRTVNDELQARNQEVGQINDDFSNTLSSIKAPIVMLDRALRLRRFTAAAGTLLNLIPADLSRPLGDLKPVFAIPDVAAMLLEVIVTLQAKEQEVQDRAGRWYLLLMHPYRTGDNRIDGVVLLFRDIDEERRTNVALALASSAKDHFLAVLSHELRNPLTPVMQSLAALEKLVPEEGAEYLQIARRNVELEARLIDDLLDVTRIARGKVALDIKPVELGTIIRHAAEVCQPDIDARRLHFGIEVDGGPHVVLADAARLQQVFWNLIKNAVKFTPHGGCVGVRCSSENGEAIVQVTDSGAGIENEAMGRIFNAFEQETGETTRHFGGLGLGLAISRSLVEMHRGAIRAESPGKGQGATFTVRLPLLPADADKPAPFPKSSARMVSAAGRPLRILLVEDHGDTARIMQRLLNADGHSVKCAGDVATALELAGQERFDVLVSDLGLPDGSGHDLMRKLVASGRGLPAIALSGYGMAADVQQSRDAGFVEHITKPVQIESLKQALARVVEP
jgi:two-component system, chemotaxis family, CheB/CheR fusion protein